MRPSQIRRAFRGLPYGQSSYYDIYPGPSLLRARRQYLVKNIAIGSSLCVIVIGIYAYTIHVIAQDDFEDVPIPDKPAQPAKTPNVVAAVKAGGGAKAT